MLLHLLITVIIISIICLQVSLRFKLLEVALETGIIEGKRKG